MIQLTDMLCFCFVFFWGGNNPPPKKKCSVQLQELPGHQQYTVFCITATGQEYKSLTTCHDNGECTNIALIQTLTAQLFLEYCFNAVSIHYNKMFSYQERVSLNHIMEGSPSISVPIQGK